jgi:hypothetical protein
LAWPLVLIGGGALRDILACLAISVIGKIG